MATDLAATAFPQLSFEIIDNDVENTIYTNTDSTYNRVIFRITTNTENTTFTPGSIVPPAQAPSGQGSLLYLDLSSLNLSAAEFDQIQATSTDWNCQPVAQAMLLCMTPTTTVSLSSGVGNSIDIQIAGLAISNPPAAGSVQLLATYYRVSPIVSGTLGIPTQFKVLLAPEPDVHDLDLHQAIAVSIDNSSIIASLPGSTVNNSFTLTLGPGPDGTTVPAGPGTTFTLTFVYGTGDGYGALTDATSASNIGVEAGPNAANWGITKGTNQQDPSWLLTPPNGAPLVGTGAQSNVAFLASQIATTFRPGPTTMILSYANVPGYQDGSYAITLNKIPHVTIDSLSVSPSPVYLENGSAQVTIGWQVEYATALALSPLPNPDVTGQTSVQTTVTDTTPFTLAASGPGADRDNVFYWTTTALVLPRINSFTAAPQAIYARDFPSETNLAWAVDWSGRVEVLSSVAGGSDQYAPVDSVTRTLNGPQMLTLQPVTGGGTPAPGRTRNIQIAAFQTQLQNVAMSPAPSYVVASPTAPILAVAGQNQVWFVDDVTFQTVGSAIATGPSPSIAFSPDGSFLIVASGNGSLEQIRITPTDSRPAYTFNSVTLPSVGGQPVAVAISRDGTTIFVAVRGANGAGSLVVLESNDSDFSVSDTVAVGSGPGGIALDPSGSRVFVSNSADNTVSVVGADMHGSYSNVLTLANIGADPAGLAVSPDGSILLVACAGANAVYALNTKYPDTTVPQQLAVSNPWQIAFMPGGKYAFVTQRNGSAVSLISCGDQPSGCTVIEPSIAVGTGPVGVSVTAENGVALVGNQGSSSISVLTLAAYQQPGAPVAVGGLPTDVAAAPDGSLVVAWHNAQRTVFGTTGQPSPGLWVYVTASGTVSPELPSEKIVGCVFDPDPGAHTAYLVALNGPLTVLNTQSFTTQTVPIASSGQTRNPDLLGISADGQRLFVVADEGTPNYHVVVFDVSGASPQKLTDIPLYTAPGIGFMAMCVSPDGSQAFISNSIDSSLHVVQSAAGTYEVNATAPTLTGLPVALTILPDASAVYVLSSTGMDYTIAVVDPSSLEARTVTIGQSLQGVTLQDVVASPDGTRLFATDSAADAIRVIDPVSLRFIQKLTCSSQARGPYGICVLPDGSRIFTANVLSDNITIVSQVQPA